MKDQTFLNRVARHLRITRQALSNRQYSTPPFLIFFVNSICNLKCEHCFYWRNLNQKDDLTFDEIIDFAKDYGEFENLNLSGGEPFIRKELGEICRFFVRNNKVKQIYIPTNGYFPDLTVKHVKEILKEDALKLLVVEISLDGTPEYHNRLRGNKKSFERAMKTYKALEELLPMDDRLRIHSNTTVTADNMEEVKELSKYLYENCPSIEHHNIAIIRGDRKNPSLQGPALEGYKNVYEYVKKVWRARDEGRFGSIVEPMLQWGKLATAKKGKQYIPCLAGKLVAVVYANGDVSVCESLPPLNNLRNKKFSQIWSSEDAQKTRQSIRDKECYCTNEVFMWPSITFQPLQLVKAMILAPRK